MPAQPTRSGSWIPDTSTFAARAALVRHTMQWNLREAAVECGLAINAWGRYEAGFIPRDYPATIGKITARTGVDPMWLAFGSEPTPRAEPKQLLPDLDSNQEPAGLPLRSVA